MLNILKESNFNSLKKGAIYYFSGTGNTAYVAEEFSKLFKQKDIFVDLHSIENISTVHSQSRYDFIAIGFPTYAWYPPKVVLSFIKLLPIVKDKPCFIFTTYRFSTGSSLNVVKDILKKKNYRIIGLFPYKMPHNIPFLFRKEVESENDIKELIRKTTLNIRRDFQNLFKNKIKLKKSFFLIKLISKLVSFLFNIFIIKRVKWVVDYNKCNQCGLCEKICTTKNIIVKHKKRKVIFGDNCLFCMRCYNFCPQQAIEYKSLKRTKDNKRYNYFKNKIM